MEGSEDRTRGPWRSSGATDLPSGYLGAGMRRACLTLVLALCASLSLLACLGGDGEGMKPSSPTPAQSPVASSSSSSSAAAGQVRLTFEASCRVHVDGKGELEVRYSARAEGDAMLTRVRLIVNDREMEDSGPLNQKEYRRIATMGADAGQRYTYQVRAEAPGTQPPRVQGVVQCPQPPTPTGPRL